MPQPMRRKAGVELAEIILGQFNPIRTLAFDRPGAKDETGQPQFRADLSNWNLAPEVSDALFTFTPPNGADRIQFLTEVGNAAAPATSKKGGKK